MDIIFEFLDRKKYVILRTYLYSVENDWNSIPDQSLNSNNTLLIFFGAADGRIIESELKNLQRNFPDSLMVGCSTAGEIFNEGLYDDSISLAILKFESSQIRLVSTKIDETHESRNAGIKLAKELLKDDLKAAFILSEGLLVNGSDLVTGLNQVLERKVTITGGLAADGDRFENTWVWNQGQFTSGVIAAIGFYGKNLGFSHGSRGGWKLLGPDREVTASVDNVLFELDGKPALELYKKHLGELKDDLPASGLLFPLAIRSEREDGDIVRTILAVDESEQSITFAGNVPKGSCVRLMRASFDHLVDGAMSAASGINFSEYKGGDLLSLAISCIGRRLLLGQRTEDELEVVMQELPENCQQIGFYSYGEISPLASGRCDLHNQTMTLTLIWEN